MLNKSKRFVQAFAIALLLGGASSVSAAEMPAHKSTQFRRIEQPLPVKAAVTLGGLGLISLELWWFLFSKNKVQKAEKNQEFQEVTITVDGGYEPDRIEVEAGQTVRLNFFRKDPSSCLEKVLLPDFHVAKDLPMEQITPVEFTPTEPGEYQFTCGMNMYCGTIAVQQSSEIENRDRETEIEAAHR